ncbi:TlpA family protein disulfide reductase [Salinibacter altiplanensis]|uniref:TlpA family protein disulfide reductase n=1 Tax=Salinibacter altiplanensis TaxID=1803181 RepID=UPI000C9FD679|nr:TlpA disulfide reductase family protein [Salinibacter altiplanensis]
MNDLGLDSEVSAEPNGAGAFWTGPVSTALAALLLAAATLLGIGSHPARARSQDTIRVAGTALGPGDSATARQLLQADLGPRSPRWARLYDSKGRGQAAKTFMQMARLAYPSEARADSMLAFFRSAGTDHPDLQVQAEFLFGGLQVASSADREAAREEFYRRLTSEHKGSRYAEQARRLYSPDSQIEAGKPLPELRLPKLSDPTATVEKSDFEGRVFLVDFWGTWCPPCVRAMPHLHEAYRQHGGEEFTILSVALRDSRKAIEEFRANEWEMPWNHAFVLKGSDLQKRLRGQFDIRGLPLAILVGPGGKILHVSRGVGSGEKTAQAIRDAVAEEDAEDASSPESISEGNSDR